MRRAKNLVCDEHAAELVEFAFAAAIFFTLIFGIVEFCLVMYAGNFAAYAAQQGARYAMVRGSDWTAKTCATTTTFDCQANQGNVQNYVLSLPSPPGVNLAANDITVTWPDRNVAGGVCAAGAESQGCQVKVNVSYTFNLSIPFLSKSIPISGTAEETIQD